jgi:uncharacterized protein (DUF2235 family)
MGNKNVYYPRLSQFKKRDRHFVICIDGTWNDPSDAEEKGSGTTNVFRFHNAVARDDESHYARYFPGVGNQEQNWFLGQALGGALGIGVRQIRNEAYVALVTNYRPGDRLFLLGFSRGAAIARMLAALIHKEGIPESITIVKDENGRVVDFDNDGKKTKIDIEMLGVWDTVASFGIPVNLFGIPFQRINLFTDFTVAPNVKKAYHLLAVDENRDAFTPTLMNQAPKIEEVWFAGVHADVGGGYDKRGLADITLQYMIERAQTHGVVFHQPSVDALSPDSGGVLHRHRDRPADYKMGHRKIGVQKKNKNTAASKPKIHRSVVERMDKLGREYRPKSILDLNKKFEVVGT